MHVVYGNWFTLQKVSCAIGRWMEGWLGIQISFKISILKNLCEGNGITLWNTSTHFLIVCPWVWTWVFVYLRQVVRLILAWIFISDISVCHCECCNLGSLDSALSTLKLEFPPSDSLLHVWPVLVPQFPKLKKTERTLMSYSNKRKQAKIMIFQTLGLCY